jgi:hypothetical protein
VTGRVADQNETAHWQYRHRLRQAYQAPHLKKKFLLHDCHKQKLSGFTNACQISMNRR